MNNLQRRNNSDLSPVSRLETMMAELLEIQTGSAKRIESIDDRTTSLEGRMKNLEDNTEITTEQRNAIRRSVSRVVYELLELPPKKHDWALEHKVISDKYSSLFHRRCYTEVSRKGHLATPYGTTPQKHFVDAIKDIEAWIPSNGISGLKKEADENAIARKIAKEQGY